MSLYSNPNYDAETKLPKKFDVFENAVILMQEYYDEINSLLIELARLKRRLWMLVSILPRREMIDVMAYTIIEKRKYCDIAREMGYSPRTIRRLADKASDIINEQNEDPFFAKAIDRAVDENRFLADVLKEDFDYDCGQHTPEISEDLSRTIDENHLNDA